jgi:hypothetical protein
VARIDCPSCRTAVTYLEEARSGPLSCPGCGEALLTADGQPPPRPRGGDSWAVPSLQAREVPVKDGPAPPRDPPRRASAEREREPPRPRHGPTAEDLSEPQLFFHLFWAVVYLFAGAMALFTCGLGLLFNGLSLLVVYFLFAGAGRRIHSLCAGPRFRLTADGIELRYWEKSTFPSVAMLLPMRLMVERVIPWRDYARCQTYTFKYNGATQWRSLTIWTEGGEAFEIGWDIFVADVDDLQSALLIYARRVFAAAARDVLDTGL